MLLAIDVGNTNIKFAFFEGEKIIRTFRLTTQTERTSDEFGMYIQGLSEDFGIKKEDIDGVVISSVVPNVMHALNNSIKKFLNLTPLIVGPGVKTGIKLVKTNPSEVGSDRIADGVAALNMYGGPVIVVDYGTATKFDYFSADGVFESAVTCPGLIISARALWGGTARLPEIEIKDPGTIMAKDTITSLQAGIMYGHIGEAEYIINRLKAESKEKNIKVVATGGLSNIIAQGTDAIQFVEPDLLMHGLRIIYEKNK
ncbi:MAG: type III pantothenate kinase [Lachnospiraceae bacterium]|nr:type III pantothenate kinase [Lachnospiraceae bacterium]